MDMLTPLTARLGELLKSRKEAIAVAESSTGGLISAALLAVPGASAYFRGGGVIYTARSRDELLGLTSEMMPGVRSSTEAYARALAGRVRDRLGTVWGLGETGAAGPAGNRYGDAPGHSCIAVAGPVERVITVETGQSGREANMWAFTRAALELLESAVREADREPGRSGRT
jgi:PncC family amidohydrolase